MAPALLAGTSSEFLGRRALPRILHERSVVFVLGPSGAGKTSVAMRLGRAGGDPMYVDTRTLLNLSIERVAQCKWPDAIVHADSLVLDGPVWLRNRAGMVDVLVELIRVRQAAGRRTLVCQSDDDCSLEALMGAMEAGSLVVIGLRFPKGSRGRLRFARRVCDELGLPRSAARGTELIAPWGYARVIEHLGEWATRALGEPPERRQSSA